MKDDILNFTDDCATINNLKMQGFQFSASRKQHLDKIVMQYGVKLCGDELTISASPRDFAQKKHMLLQAMLRVDDMFTMSKSKVASLFSDDVKDFLDKKDIYYTDDVQFTGISGFVHNYELLLQRTRSKPERLCRAVNIASKSNVSNILFSWNDTKPARKPDSQLIVFLNDNNSVGQGIEEAFHNYGANIIYWTQRDKPENLELISA